MYCKNCGAEVTEAHLFCSTCGAKINGENATESVEVVDEKEEVIEKQSKCWQVFANIGFGLGLGSLIGFWFFTVSIFSAITGLVFSILGKRSNVNGQRAKTGIVLSSIALVLAQIMWILMFASVIESVTSLY